MAVTLTNFPSRVRFVDANGLLTAEALKALSGMFVRMGGPVAPSITELAQADDDDSGLEEFKHEFGKALDGLGMAPLLAFDPLADPLHPLAYERQEVQQLQAELNGLREQVAVLMQQINDIKQGVTP